MSRTEAPVRAVSSSTLWTSVCVIFAVSLLGSCSVLQLEHVSAFREIQDDFNAAATEENQQSLDVISADALEINARGRDQSLQSPISLAQAESLHSQYHQVFISINALLSRAQGELMADGLVANALTLRVMARWRMAFFGQMVAALRGVDGEGQMPSQKERQPAPHSLSAVTTTAEQTQSAIARLRDAQKGLPPYPRDEFLLQALANGSLIRYDIAYIRTLRAYRAPPQSRAILLPLAEEMAKAERDLSGTGTPPAHLRSYIAAARLLMLGTADSICNELSVDYRAADMRQRLPNLIERLSIAFTDFEADNDPTGLRNALRAINQGTRLDTFLTKPTL